MHDLHIGQSPSVARDIVSVVGVVDESGSEMEGCNFQ